MRWEQNSAWVCGPGGGRLQRGANAWRPPFGSHRDGGCGGGDGEGFHDAPVPSPDLSPPFPLFPPLFLPAPHGGGGGCLCERGDGGPRPAREPLPRFPPPPPPSQARGTKKGERGGKGRAKKVRSSSSSRPPPVPDTRPPVRLLSSHPPSPFSRDSVEGCARGEGGAGGGGRRRGGFDGGWDGTGRGITGGMGRAIPPVIPRSPCPPPRHPPPPPTPSKPSRRRRRPAPTLGGAAAAAALLLPLPPEVPPTHARTHHPICPAVAHFLPDEGRS